MLYILLTIFDQAIDIMLITLWNHCKYLLNFQVNDKQMPLIMHEDNSLELHDENNYLFRSFGFDHTPDRVEMDEWFHC